MATTRSERRRRWFLRSWALSGWLTDWRAELRAASEALPSKHGAGVDSHARLWQKFAADSRVPSGVTLLVRQRDTGVTITFPLADPYLLIGNHPRCQLQLSGLPDRETQYALFWLQGELYGVDLRMNSPHQTEEPCCDGWWTDGETLRLGEYEIKVRGLPGLPSRTVRIDDDSTITLHLESLVGRQERHLTRWLTLIGCAAESEVMIRDPSIAARQAALIRTPTSLWMINLAEGLPPRMAHRTLEWSALDPMDELSFGEIKVYTVRTWPEQTAAFNETAPHSVEIPSSAGTR